MGEWVSQKGEGRGGWGVEKERRVGWGGGMVGETDHGHLGGGGENMLLTFYRSSLEDVGNIWKEGYEY